jgi:hypothetical protein
MAIAQFVAASGQRKTPDQGDRSEERRRFL